VSEAAHEEVLRYLRFEAADRARLSRALPLVEAHLPSIAQAFYDRIREHDDAHAVFRDEAQVDRLTRSLEAWMRQVFVGAYDGRYFERIERIGEVHVEIGLPERYMPLAMTLVRLALAGHLAAGPDAEATTASLHKALDAHLTVMLTAYAKHLQQRIRRAERADTAVLRSSVERLEHEYAALFALARLLVIGIDDQGRVLLVNDELTRLTGYARDELLTQPVLHLVAEQADPQPLASALRAVLEGHERRVDVDVELTTRAGQQRTAHLSVVRQEHAGASSPIAAYVLGQDVTDERAREERTRQTERLAAVGTLAAGLAHEIRNPLNGAHLAVRFLDRTLARAGLEGEPREAVRTIDHEIARLSSLVTEFLQFARPQPLVRHPVSLTELLKHASGLLAGAAIDANVTLACDLPTADVVVAGDADKLEQVILNLGRNALEAIADTKKPGRVTLRLRRTPRSALVEVRDDGPGLPSPDAPIFDAFFSTKPAGTGLGLSIAHRIVTDHDGRIDVESSPAGTTFRVWLPLLRPGGLFPKDAPPGERDPSE
jgi:PAS domain S-box-containing protein